MQFWAPDDGRKTRLKHVERFTEINILWNVASCWLYSTNTYISDARTYEWKKKKTNRVLKSTTHKCIQIHLRQPYNSWLSTHLDESWLVFLSSSVCYCDLSHCTVDQTSTELLNCRLLLPVHITSFIAIIIISTIKIGIYLSNVFHNFWFTAINFSKTENNLNFT